MGAIQILDDGILLQNLPNSTKRAQVLDFHIYHKDGIIFFAKLLQYEQMILERFREWQQ